MKTMFCLAMALLLASCYHFGGTGVAKSVHIAPIQNRTNEATLGASLRQCLQEQFGVRPGLANGKSAYTLHATILQVANRSMARAEMRDKKSRDDDDNAYQTVLYGIEVAVQYELVAEGEGAPAPLTGKVIGRASLPRMHDRNVALKTALQQAALDAARQLADLVADAP